MDRLTGTLGFLNKAFDSLFLVTQLASRLDPLTIVQLDGFLIPLMGEWMTDLTPSFGGLFRWSIKERIKDGHCNRATNEDGDHGYGEGFKDLHEGGISVGCLVIHIGTCYSLDVEAV